MLRSSFCVLIFCATCGSFAQDGTVNGRVIKVFPLSSAEKVSEMKTEQNRDTYNIPQINGEKALGNSVHESNTPSGVQILKGTVNENIIRIAKTELGIPESNVDFRYIPCDLLEKYTYVIPETHFTNKYERLTYYASQYSFFSTFNPMTNTVTLEYRGPDVFEHCRKSK